VQLLRKLVILSHRYLGIAISLLVVVWFVSGILMIYTGGMPTIDPQDRLDRLAPLEVSKIRMSPAQASESAGFDPEVGFDGRVTLLTLMERPVYRFAGEGTVFADTGEMMEELSAEQSRAVAAGYLKLPPEKVHLMREVTEVDQWTIGLGRQMPLYKFSADDGRGSELYVQPQSGEVAMRTTRRSRALAWASTIPHWLYFASLRANQPLWYQIVVWTSALACILTVLGLILGVTQFRRPKPFHLSAAIPYSGWMRWHYLTGVIFGLFTLTWAFSGLLSMEPFEWTRAEGLEIPRETFTGGPLDLAQYTALDPIASNQLLASRSLKEVELVRIQDEPYYVMRTGPAEAVARQPRERLHQPYAVTGRAEPDRLLVSAKTLELRRKPFSTESLVARLHAAVPDAPIVEQQLLTEYDSYYYSRGRQTPLPVLRVKFGDPAETWLYIDPEMSRVVTGVHRLSRVERWLYSGLHNLDFAFWYDRRPLWDIGMIALMLGGLASSSIGLLLSIKRVWRAL
jgi:hypothetical protein